jgi:hypothetical protein
MASSDAKHAPGGHYSGRNPVPNIQRFLENMDKDKKARDAQIDAQATAPSAGPDAMDHSPDNKPVGVKGTRKTVTDPTTGKQVQIEDVDANFMKSVDEPVVGLPAICYEVNAN